MKKALYTSVLAVILIVSMSVDAFAAGAGDLSRSQDQERLQDQIQQQDRNQTCVSEADKEQSRLQLKSKLQIAEQALTKQQERAQQKDKSQACFSDVQQHWAIEQIESVYSWGLINGYPDGSYNPSGNISGIEGVLIASRITNCLDGELAQGGTADDVDWTQVPLWARDQLMEASALRIATQSQDYGEAQLNRLQLAVMLAKAIGIEPAEVPNDSVVFLDQNEIPTYELEYINALRTLGIVNGNNGKFYPNQAVTRAEAAAMLSQVLEIFE